jgi:O-antigen/teichoic acid export membrane protein
LTTLSLAGTQQDGRFGKDQFSTAHLQVHLKRKSIDGGIITILAQSGKFLLGLAGVAVLARLLTPEDYGLVAMVAPITGFIGLFKDLGLSMATVQKEDITHAQVNTLFWINVALALVLTVICACLSPLAGMFYGDRRTIGIMLASAAVFVFSGLTAQHQALLNRQMRFGTLATIEIITVACSIAIGIATAFLGWGYWALVAIGFGGGLVNCIAVWHYSAWRPSFPKAGAEVGEMLRFGSSLTGSQVCGYISGNFDKLLIGKSLGAPSLGMYGRAFQLLVMPLQMVFTPISGVLVPVLSRLVGQPERYRSMVRQAADLMLMATTPLGAISIVAADPIVFIFLGPRWVEVADIFRALSLVAIAIPMNNLCVTVLQSSGRADVLLRWGFKSMLISLASILIGLHWGMEGIAYSWALGGLLIRTPWFYFVVSRHTAVRLSDLVRPLGFHLLPFSIMVASGFALHSSLKSVSPVLSLLIYAGVCVLLNGTLLLASGKHKLVLTLFRRREVSA